MDCKKVLILSEKFGAGHERAALALSKGIKNISPDTEVKVINFFQYFHPHVSKVTLKMYLSAINMKPEIWGYFYERERNKKKAGLAKKLLRSAMYFFLREILDKERPDVIVCTHPFPACVASRLKQKGLETPLAVVITDFDVHGFWINDHTNAYITADEFLLKPMLDFGINPSIIYPTGIPIDPNFHREVIGTDAKRALGFREDVPLLLVTGGGLGLTVLDEYTVKQLASATVQLAIICGKNPPLREALRRIVAENHLDNVRVLGFVRNMWDYMGAADLLITKAGGLTIAEAISKELPIVLYNPLPGQEERNAAFLLKKGVAKKAQNQKELVDLVKELTRNKHLIQTMKRNAAGLKKTRPAEKAADIVLSLADHGNKTALISF
ncbi:MGDG synthase family glycosyltransferase [Thermosediminibacter oceani]|uniref:Monogalactosyldiacylglycerol synthase n=1 Tax=Thermosediminibacter oceani (strain ATCC BAA-1034 / DSM 16646 / JW/IW-1228P) TaxID=555079 RepID=D9RZ45_THEOJ|nr:glycosyltransferase [Thermosediminibacter oceani]ADL08599.1 Monogalactosyldiacylglycerol synthase [Thermosediminibacter oceani DSM 16646]